MKWVLLSALVSVALFAVLGYSHKVWRLRGRQFFALAGFLIILAGMIATVPTGHTGILTTFGRVEDTTLEAGIHIKSPFQEVVVMDNRTQVARVELSCFSSDIQEVVVNYSMNYQIDKKNAQTIYKTIGVDYYTTVMQPRIQEVVKSVIAKYSAESLVESRDALSVKITQTLVTELGAYNIEVVSTSVENIDFSDAFTQSVEEKVVAEQAFLKAKTEQEQKTMEKEEEAKRQEISANAEAAVVKIAAEADASVVKVRAEADAQVAKVKADADAYAGEKKAQVNALIAASLTDDLLEYYTINAWDGKLPAYFVTGSDTVLPILGSAVTAAGTDAGTGTGTVPTNQ